MSKATQLNKTFAWEFVRTNSGMQAYLNATQQTAVTPKDRVRASVKAQQMLSRPQVKKYLQTIRDEQRIGVTEIVDELAQIIRFDVADMLNDDGTVKPIHQMPETARKMIAGLEVSELWMGRGKNKEQYGVVKKIKFLSKMDAIEKAMKHLGGYKEDNDQKKAVTQIAIFQLPDNDRDNTRLIDVSEKVIEIEIGESLETDVIEGKPQLFSSVGKVEKGKREKVTAEPGSMEPGSMEPGSMEPGSMEPGSMEPGSMEPGSMQGPEAGRGTRVQGKPSAGVGVKPDIQTEFGPGD